jgi:hypothetical protein
MSNFEHTSRLLTQAIMRKIDALPAPVKTMIGFLPGGGTVTGYAENHRWAVVKLAKHYAMTGKLSPASRAALQEYERHREAESRAYERLVRAIDREL